MRRSSIIIAFIIFLAGCQSSWRQSWRQPIPNVEIIYQSNVFVKPYTLGFIQADGTHAAMLEIAERLIKPVWSQNATIIYGLSVSSVSYIGYPAFWDTVTGKFKFCN